MSIEKLIEDQSFIHQEHGEWLSQLNFYQDEIKFFQNELMLVLHKNNDSFSFISTVDEYKEIFLKKLEHIDEIRHEIVRHEKSLSKGGRAGQQLSEDANHNNIRSELNKFISEFEFMKIKFKRFAAHND